MTTVLNKGAWPSQITRVMSMAMADLGIENFEYDPQVMAEGADFGRGCRVMQLAGSAPRWCVVVEIPDRIVLDSAGADVARDRIRKQMDDFVQRVLVVPGWRPYPSWTSCGKRGAATRWLPTYTPNGGYGRSFQTYLIWDQSIEQKDLASPLVDTIAVQKLDATATFGPASEANSIKKDPSWRAAIEGVTRHHTTRIDQLSRRLDAPEKQAGPVGRPPSFQGVWQPQSRSGLDDPFYAVPASPDPTASYGDLFVSAMGSDGSDSDSKDALIRDLYREFLHPTGTTPGVLYEARAEKLGVKL